MHLPDIAPVVIVSIAEAILWGEQPVMLAALPDGCIVSIAEAILWGEQPKTFAAL